MKVSKKITVTIPNKKWRVQHGRSAMLEGSLVYLEELVLVVSSQNH